MSEENVQQGNPKVVDESVFGSSSEDFFSALESDVNGVVQDNAEDTSAVQNKATSNQSPKVEQKDKPVSQEVPELDTLKKRYSDSSREAQKLKAQLNELKPFVPVLDAMKKDSGLIEHVRDYFNSGGDASKNIKQKLKLDEDFVFDPDEMVNKPDSDSAKVFNVMVDNIVKQRASQIMTEQGKLEAQKDAKNHLQAQAADFQKRHKMSPEDFESFVSVAEKRFREKGMTFDDVYYYESRQC